MVTHDLPLPKLTDLIAFDQRDLHLTPEFERAMDRRCQALVFKLPSLLLYSIEKFGIIPSVSLKKQELLIWVTG